jgi:hypothetical protein
MLANLNTLFSYVKNNTELNIDDNDNKLIKYSFEQVQNFL